MFRTILFLVVISLVGVFFAYLADTNGTVVIYWLNSYRIDTEAYVLWAMLLALVVVLYIIASLLARLHILGYKWHHRQQLKTLQRWQHNQRQNNELLLQILLQKIQRDHKSLAKTWKKYQRQPEVDPRFITLLPLIFQQSSSTSRDTKRALQLMDPKDPHTKIYALREELAKLDADDVLARVNILRQMQKLEPKNPNHQQELLHIYKVNGWWSEAITMTGLEDYQVSLGLLADAYSQKNYALVAKLAKKVRGLAVQEDYSSYLIASIFLLRALLKQHKYWWALWELRYNYRKGMDMTLVRLARYIYYQNYGGRSAKYLTPARLLLANRRLIPEQMFLAIYCYIMAGKFGVAKQLLQENLAKFAYSDLYLLKALLELQEFGNNSFYHDLCHELPKQAGYRAWYCNGCGRRYRFWHSKCGQGHDFGLLYMPDAKIV